MNAVDRRIEEDIKKIRGLELEYQGTVRLVNAHASAQSGLVLSIRLPTAANREYPSTVQHESSIRVEFVSRYPLEPPRVVVLSPVFNPNVYTSGLICLGEKWLPTQGLDLLILRVMRLLALDPAIVNVKSPANGEAARWYSQTVKRFPQYFPTVDISKLRRVESPPKLVWRNLSM